MKTLKKRANSSYSFQKLVDDMSEYDVCHISGKDAMMDIDGMWRVATAKHVSGKQDGNSKTTSSSETKPIETSQ